jgi:uncharacterized protein YkwD
MQLVPHPLIALIILIGALVCLGLLGSSPASAGPTFADRIESSVVVATNHSRVQRDRRAVRGNACVDRMAESWARHLAQTRSLTHRRLGRVLSRCNRSYVSENLAKYPVSSGMTATQVARSTVRAWMRSAEHRRILLSPRPRVIGLGVARSATGTLFIVQNFAR